MKRDDIPLLMITVSVGAMCVILAYATVILAQRTPLEELMGRIAAMMIVPALWFNFKVLQRLGLFR